MTGSSVPLSDTEIDCYLAAADWICDVVSRPEVGVAWERPSALTHYSVGGVAVHAVQGGMERLLQVLGEPEPKSWTLVDIPTYFAPNRMSGPENDDPLFVQLGRICAERARQGQEMLVRQCRAALIELASLLPTIAADRRMPLVRLPDAVSTASDTLRTRILELIVHGDDLVASVPGMVVREPPREAVDVCVGVCLELARARVGDVGVLRAFTRAERAEPEALRVL